MKTYWELEIQPLKFTSTLDIGEYFNFIELNCLYTTQLTVVNLQLAISATCFGLIWPSSGLQSLVSIKVHNVAVPMGSHGLHCLYVPY